MKKFDFSKEFGNIDLKYIREAEGEWKGKKKAWAPSFWSKLVAACVPDTAIGNTGLDVSAKQDTATGVRK